MAFKPQTLAAGGTVTGAINFNDDVPLYFGTSNDAFFQWETADANANALILGLPDGDATNVPIFVVGAGSSINNVDLGLFDGETNPGIAILSPDGTKGVIIQAKDNVLHTFSGVNGTADQLQFTGLGALYTPQIFMSANAGFYLGSGFQMRAVTTGVSTNTAIHMGLRANYPLVITDGDVNMATSFGKGVSENYPRVYITSDKAFSTATDEFILLFHDGNNGVLASGKGMVTLGSAESGITASTTQTQGQQPLTRNLNEVSTVGNANDVVTLPGAYESAEIKIINNGANVLQIFPASGDNLGAGVNNSTTLASGSNITFVAYDSTNWEVF